MNIDAITLALITILPAVLTALFTFLITRRMQPSAIASAKIDAQQNAAETATIALANNERLYNMYTKLSGDMMGVLDELRGQKKLIGEQASEIQRVTGENEQLRRELTISNKRTEFAEAAVVILQQQVADYPARVETLRSRIELLERVIVNKDAEAAERAATGLADAQARQSTADKALIDVGGTPQGTPPDITPHETLGKVSGL